MLDIMRQKKQMKAIVLWVVIIATGFSMVVWGVALNLGGSSGGTDPNSYAAIVDNRTITIQEFEDTFEQSIRNLKESAQGELDPELIKSLGLSQQVLNGLITGKIVEILADRLNVSVSPDEIRQAILQYPQLQVNGKFIGLEQYKAILARNGIKLENFEDDVRYEELAIKLQHVITDSLDVSNEALKKEFSKTTETTKVEYVLLNADSFKKRVKPTEAELQAYFEKHKNAYEVKEKRRAEYLLVPTSKILPDIKVSEQEIKDEWARNPLPETVEAAHILFLVKDPSQEAAVRAKAESVLKQLRNGADFAAMARKYSDDTSNAKEGGYLGTFPRGRMVKEFEDVAFSLKPGEISGLVRTKDYGFHIIKVFRHNKPTLEANRAEVENTVRLRKAKELAKQKAEEAAKIAADQKDFSSIGKKIGVDTEIKETGLFTKDENPYSLGISQALRDDIFNIKSVGELGTVAEHALGYAVPRLQEVQKARPGTLEEFKDQVRKDFIDSSALDLMQAEAKKISVDAEQLKSLAKAAGQFGYKVKTSPDFKIEDSPGPGIEDKDAFNFVAFQLAPGSISQPITMSNSVAVLKVENHSPFDEAAFEKEKDSLRESMLTSLQTAYMDAYLSSFRDKLEEAGKIRVNPEVFTLVDNMRF